MGRFWWVQRYKIMLKMANFAGKIKKNRVVFLNNGDFGVSL
jgi:hypothetical protein